MEPTGDSDADEDGSAGARSDSDSELDSDEEMQAFADETVHVAIETVRQGEEKLEAIQEMKENMMAQVRFLEEMGRCCPEDPHLEELPPVGINHIKAWETAHKRFESLKRSRTLQPTFGGLRTGNVFTHL